MSKVFISVGHGGQDGGAVGNGLKEKDLNLTVATSVYNELKRHNVACMLSRNSDVTESLGEKINECKKYNPNYALDIHFNSGGGKGDGFEVFHHHKGGKGKTLSKNIEEEVIKIGQNSRGLKTRKNSDGNDYYGFIRNTTCPSIIIECAFIDNKNDISIADTIVEQVQFGVAIAKGVLKTLGINYKPSSETVTTKPKEQLYRVICGSYKEYDNAKRKLEELKVNGFESFIECKKE